MTRAVRPPHGAVAFTRGVGGGDVNTREAKVLAVTLGAPLVAQGLAQSLETKAAKRWYHRLDRPAWTPPDRVFAPVWTALYACMGVGAWLAWRATGDRGTLRR